MSLQETKSFQTFSKLVCNRTSGYIAAVLNDKQYNSIKSIIHNGNYVLGYYVGHKTLDSKTSRIFILVEIQNPKTIPDLVDNELIQDCYPVIDDIFQKEHNVFMIIVNILKEYENAYFEFIKSNYNQMFKPSALRSLVGRFNPNTGKPVFSYQAMLNPNELDDDTDKKLYDNIKEYWEELLGVVFSDAAQMDDRLNLVEEIYDFDIETIDKNSIPEYLVVDLEENRHKFHNRQIEVAESIISKFFT